MSDWLTAILYISLFIHILLSFVGVWKIWRGENIIDRIMAVDLFTTLILAVLIISAILSLRSIYIDVALGLAALAFISTIALARYSVEEQIL